LGEFVQLAEKANEKSPGEIFGPVVCLATHALYEAMLTQLGENFGSQYSMVPGP
jgi:hypothetical protein